MLLRFVPMRSGSQQCLNVVSWSRPFTAITRVQIPSGTPIRILDLQRSFRSGVGTDAHKNAPPTASTEKEIQHSRGYPPQFRGHKWAQVPPPDRQHLDFLDPTNNLTTALWAFRFCSVIAWVYVSSVTLAEACRSSSCITLISVPFARKIVE